MTDTTEAFSATDKRHNAVILEIYVLEKFSKKNNKNGVSKSSHEMSRPDPPVSSDYSDDTKEARNLSEVRCTACFASLSKAPSL